MEKVYDIYVNGELEYQSVSMEEKNANAKDFAYWLKSYGEAPAIVAAIENGAELEFIEE